MFSSCAVQTVCPAYHSAFILDENEQKKAYSLFTEVEGEFVPKRPYGLKFEVNDEASEKFIQATQGKGFRVQKGRVHPFEKFGFTYYNRVKENLFARVFRAKEKPVLENPYLFDKIFKKRPFYKFDTQPKEITHFNRPYYDSLVAQVIDTARFRALNDEYNAMPAPIQAQYAPLLRGGFNVEQDAYNQRFGNRFLKLKAPDPVDSMSLKQMAADTLSVDTLAKKKGFFGLFKRKNKPNKERKRRKRRNNEEGVLNEDKE